MRCPGGYGRSSPAADTNTDSPSAASTTANHEGSSDADTFTIGKVKLTGIASTQNALNIAKQGSMVVDINSISGLVGTDTLASVFGAMAFRLEIGSNTYDFQPTVSVISSGQVLVTYSLKSGGDAGQIAADLQALNLVDGTASTSASNAQVARLVIYGDTSNYSFGDDFFTADDALPYDEKAFDDGVLDVAERPTTESSDD